MSIKTNVLSDRIEVAFPCELIPLFEELFKAARWCGSGKVWILKNTAVNRANIERFKGAANGLSIRMLELREAEFKVQEIEFMYREITRLEKETDYNLDGYQAFLKVNEDLDSLKRLYQVSWTVAEEAVEKAAAVKQEAESKVNAILSVYGAHELIEKLLSKSRLGRDLGEREAVKNKLFEIYGMIRRDYFLEVEMLNELYTASWYRLGRYKLSEVLKKLYKNVKVVRSVGGE